VSLSPELDSKMRELRKIILEMQSMLVAYSGGVDSTFLLKIVKDVLSDNVVAVTAQSLVYPAGELKEAQELAKTIGVEHIVIESNELDIPEFAQNTPDRCYYCRKVLFSKFNEIARQRGLKHVVDGCNLDDTADYRPGIRAARETGVRSPLKEAKLTKEDIRKFSKQVGLSTWNKPSIACLASRFPYGDRITSEALAMVAEAEDYLYTLGFGQLRVRHHGTVSRIEVPAEDMTAFLNNRLRTQIVDHLKAIGYTYVALDLQGYRTGSMNETL